MLGYAFLDVLRNPLRTMAAVVGIALGVALFSAVLFYDQGSKATLTRRAIAPLALDMQTLLTAPLGRELAFEERVDGPETVEAGGEARFTLTVSNGAATAAHDVVVNDEPAAPLQYVPGSLLRDGVPEPDVGGQIALSQGAAHVGLNVGTLAPGERVVLEYRASAPAPTPRSRIPVQGRISTREHVVPLVANASAPVTVDGLRSAIEQIPGVVGADGLWHVDLPASAVHLGPASVGRPLRVFGFDQRYQQHYPSIRMVSGSLHADGAVVSVETARALAARAGDVLRVDLPGGREPVFLPITGVADLSRAKPLFYSRKASKLESFLYVPDSVVISPTTFERAILPAFRAVVAAQGTVAKSVPVAEVDIQVDRARLDTDPGRALTTTTAIARSVDKVAADQTALIDNISNTLGVARADAAVARRMFAFLGLPGIALAVFLAGYSGGLLAATSRRDHALLRLRGAHRGDLARLLLVKAVVLAVVGAVIGTTLAVISVGAVLGWPALSDAGLRDLTRSALLGLGGGVLTTAIALLVPGLRSLNLDINQERREISANPVPGWRRRRLDLVVVAGAVVAEVVAYRTGGFDVPATLVSEGVSASLPYRLLLTPLLAWVGGVLVGVQLIQWLTARLPPPTRDGFGPLLRGNLVRSLRRRSWTLATGSLGVALVVAFSVGLAVFSASYDAAKDADARFTVGADLRVTPNPLHPEPISVGDAGAFRVPGVVSATPVLATPENAVLVAQFNQDRADLAAVDPAGFERTAALSDDLSPEGSGATAMAALRSRADALLISEGTAEDLSVRVGDQVQVLLARGTKQQVLKGFRVVGTFERFPGFPLGVDLVIRLDQYRAATGSDAADFFLLKARDGDPTGLDRVRAGLAAGPGRSVVVDVETTGTALNKDQSSLTALDIQGLAALDALFAAAMSAAVIGVFVFGLILHRRREYLTLRALGLRTGRLFSLVLAESGLAACCGLLVGVPVGVTTGYLLVAVVRPLFILPPVAVAPLTEVAVLALLPVLAALVSAGLATVALRRLRPSEILREG